MRIFKTYLFLLILGVVIVPHHTSYTLDDDYDVEVFMNEVKEWIKADVKSPKLTRIINELTIPTELQRQNWATLSDLQAIPLCKICKSLAKIILSLRRSGTPVETIQSTIANLCTYLNLQTKEVCHGVVALNTPVILYIVDNDPTINENDICSLLLQNQPCCKPTERYKWSISIDRGPPRMLTTQSSEKNIKILQITDIHYDPLYEPGGNANCDEPTCCRKGQNHTRENQRIAGFWGDFNNCDSPWHAVIDTLDHIKNQQKNLDLIYFTGDIIDHGVWATSRSGNTASLIKSFSKIKEIYQNIPVYPILGNHEPNPLNLFAPADVDDDHLSTRWLYELMANTWIDNGWLPESTRETIIRGGFYTVSPKPGLRLIAINNNVCYIYNWWLIYEPKDPYGQLKWLADCLLDAENNNEFVHILGHLPAGSGECQHTWSREYNKIINRFSHIITAQFNGHTHNDEFNIFYDPYNITRVINVAWNGGSITPYANLNPNYKVYEANVEKYAIEEIETWIYNLTEANLTPEKRPYWYKLYSFRDEYNLKDLTNESLNELIINMTKNISILQTYHRNFFKHAAPELEKNCDKSCLQEYICRIVTSSSSHKKECLYFDSMN